MANRIYYSQEAEQRAQSERALLALLFTGLGLSIGAALALLFAPMKGDELRNELEKRVNQTREDVEDYGKHAKKSILN